MAISGTMVEADIVKFNNAVVEVDLTPASSSFVQIESWATMVEIDPGRVSDTEEKTLDGETHVIVDGILSASMVRVTCFYTEAATTDPFINIYDHLQTNKGGAFDVRWSANNTADENQFSTVSGKLVYCTPPGYDANGNQAQKFVFEVKTKNITRTTLT